MLKLFTSLFRSEQSRPEDVAIIADDIPRYPPFAKGIPAVGVDRILRSQAELIRKTKSILRFTDAEFKAIVEPVIERYAAYVHLLPASEAHHHRGAGGLFRHGLEVGIWAAQGSEAYQFCTHDTPTEKVNNEPRWQFAAFIGGLCHDVGKPLSDVAVVDKTGQKEWNPYEASLASWSIQEGVSSYYLRWRPKRNRRHEKFSMMNLDQILTPLSKKYLNHSGPRIMEALLESIVGTGASEPLTKLVLWADSESVSRDMRAQRLDVDEYQYGVPVERFIFDAIRRTVDLAKNVNVKGGAIWRVGDAVYINWSPMVERVHQLLSKDKIPGVPKDPDVLADILIERGFAVPRLMDEGKEKRVYRYWIIYPEILDGLAVSCLRFDELDLIFNNEPPAATNAHFSKSEYEAQKQKAVSHEVEPQLTTPEHIPSDAAISDTKEEVISWKEIEQEEKASETTPPLNSLSAPEQQSPAEEANSTVGWMMIEKLMELYKTDKKNIDMASGKIAIQHPLVSEKLGDPSQVMNSFSAEKMLVNDPQFNSKTHLVGGIRYLIFNDEISNKIKPLMHHIDHGGESSPLSDAKDIAAIHSEIVDRFKKEFVQQLMAGEGDLIFFPVEEQDIDGGKRLSVLLDSESITKFSNRIGKSREYVESLFKQFPEYKGTEDAYLGKKAAKRFSYQINS